MLANQNFDLTDLEALVVGIMGGRGYLPLGPFAERHGSFQITFHALSRNLHRYVILAISDLLHGDVLALDIWVGAESDGRSARTAVVRIPVDSDMKSSSAWRKPLKQAIESAAKIAESYSANDLSAANVA